MARAYVALAERLGALLLTADRRFDRTPAVEREVEVLL
jgi:predicted nucleic acid-binding protein